MRSRRYRLLALALMVAAVLAGCGLGWRLELTYDGYELPSITRAHWRELAGLFPDEADGRGRLPLERVLWEAGAPVVEGLSVEGRTFDWLAVHADAWLRHDGRLEIAGESYKAPRIELVAPPELGLLEAEIIDLAPTIAEALGVPPPESAEGRALGAPPSRHVAYIFVDGLGYRRYQEVRGRGITPFLDTLPGPGLMLTVYPSITRTATAAMLTGAGPATSGVRDRQTRDTEADTILDVLAREGRRSVIIEGDGLPFNYRATDVRLSRDRAGDGYTDAEVLDNALSAIAEGMPDLLWVHWHGTDDAGHAHGPGSPEELARLRAVDEHISDLVTALPADTLILIASDHGMRRVDEGERRGNHGTLAPEDMLVPLWLFRVDDLRSEGVGMPPLWRTPHPVVPHGLGYSTTSISTRPAIQWLAG